MASMAHEVLVDLFKNRPSLGAELLTEALGVPLPSYAEARLLSNAQTELRPAEHRPDLVVLLLDKGVPVRVVVVEVQLGIDPRKRFRWPDYMMASRARHGCPVALLIVAPDPDVAAWCAEPIETGIPGFVLRPPVLGRAAIPVVTAPAAAARRPELGVLSAMAHGEGEHGAVIAAAVLPTIGNLDDERARFYGDLVLSCINDAARRALETMMQGYEYQEGRKEGERAFLLRQMRARFGELPAAAVTRVERAGIARLEQWAERLPTARTLAEMLGEPS